MDNPTKKVRRVTKPGCWFAGLRVAAYFVMVVGALTFAGGLVGTFVTAIRAAPPLASLFQHLDDKFGLFVFTLFATYFGVLGGLTCAGLVGIGVGILLNVVATEPKGGASIDKPSA